MATGKKLKVYFYGGAGGVTGSNFLVETVGEEKQTRVLFDCGLYQGGKMLDPQNLEKFPYDPASIDALILSHPHLDHTGRIPKLVKDGFRGRIISSHPARELAEAMMNDSMGVLEKQARSEGRDPLYSKEDVAQAMTLWESYKYHEDFSVGAFKFQLKDAGHVLGSSIVELSYGSKKFAYTGDLGNTPSPLLPDTEFVTDAHYIMIESVYGDRNHEHRSERKSMLEDVIEETINKKGVLMIPAFSLERTQELLYELKEMTENGRIPRVPIFLDSPLAIQVTAIYQKYAAYYKDEVWQKLHLGEDLFSFQGLVPTLTTDESKAIRTVPAPKIIIAGSGMSNGGRIVHHEEFYLPDPKNTLLLMGYQAPGTLGRIIQDGATTVTIHGQQIPIRARVTTISGYSAHKDSDSLLDFIHRGADTLERVFVVLGEPKSALFLVQKIRDNIGLDATAPSVGESMVLDME